MTHIYITFPTVTDSMKFEKIAKGKIPFRLVPVPREISTACGLAGKIEEQYYDQLIQLVKSENINYGYIKKISKFNPLFDN